MLDREDLAASINGAACAPASDLQGSKAVGQSEQGEEWPARAGPC